MPLLLSKLLPVPLQAPAMTLWPEQDQEQFSSDAEMWAAYRRKTARPESLTPEERNEAEGEQPEPTLTSRGRIRTTPQSLTDA